MLFRTLLLLLFAQVSVAQVSIFEPTELSEEVDFDGSLSEKFWSEIPAFSTLSHGAYSNQEPDEADRFHIAYDEEFLYIAAVIQAEQVQDYIQVEKQMTLQKDLFGLIIYPDPSNHIGYGFLSSPYGNQLDFYIDHNSYQPYPDLYTYSEWEAETMLGDSSWSVEIRIPLTALELSKKGRINDFEFQIWRNNSYYNEISTWPNIENILNEYGSMSRSGTRTARISDIVEGKRMESEIYMRPFVATNKEDQVKTTDIKFVAGVQTKINVGNQHQIKLSLIPDFEEPEPDDLLVNTDRFELFFQDRRPYFAESKTFFNQSAGRNNTMFYTREINDLNKDSIFHLSYAEYQGKFGNTELGFLNSLNTLRFEDLNESKSVFRLKQRLGDNGSHIGLMMTNVSSKAFTNQTILGVDSRYNLLNGHKIDFSYAYAIEEDQLQDTEALNMSRIHASIHRRRFLGLSYDFAMDYLGNEYSPMLGFEDWEDYLSFNGNIGLGWKARESSNLERQKVELKSMVFIDNDFWQEKLLLFGFDYLLEWKQGVKANIGFHSRTDRFETETTIFEGYEVQKGVYNQNCINLAVQSSDHQRVVYKLYVDLGDYFDGDFFRVDQKLSWAINKNMGIGFRYVQHRIYPPAYPAIETVPIHVGSIKYRLTYNKWTFQAILQGSNIEDIGLAFVNLEYRPIEKLTILLLYRSDIAFDPGRFTIKDSNYEQRTSLKAIYEF